MPLRLGRQRRDARAKPAGNQLCTLFAASAVIDPPWCPLALTDGTILFFCVVSAAIVLIALPRLAGFGREPGWMAMWAAVGWFLLPREYRRVSWWMRALVLVAILAPISTGGFAVFTVALAYEVFIKRRDGMHPLTNALLRMLGVVFAAAATWFAFNAPVLGINAKEEMNAASLDERSRVTQYGLDALTHLSLGGPVNYPNSSLNLIAAVAPNGWPYLVLVLASLLAARFTYPGVAKTTAAIGVITLTLLFSQPTGASSAVFILVVAIYAAYAPPRHNQATQQSAGLPVRTPTEKQDEGEHERRTSPDVDQQRR